MTKIDKFLTLNQLFLKVRVQILLKIKFLSAIISMNSATLNQQNERIQKLCKTPSLNTSIDSNQSQRERGNVLSPSISNQMISEPKPLQKQTKYQQKRGYIFNWLRKHCSKLKLSRQGTAMAQLMTDHYYCVMPYKGSQTRVILVTIITLCSKYCDYRIVFPQQMAYIFSIQLSQIERYEQVIICALDFNICFDNYANDLNISLNKWNQFHQFSFFRQDQHSYTQLCKAHAILEAIYERKQSITADDIQFTMKFVLRQFDEGEVEKILKQIFKNQSRPYPLENIALEVEKEWRIHKVSLEKILERRKLNENYGQFMIRYTFIE